MQLKKLTPRLVSTGLTLMAVGVALLGYLQVRTLGELATAESERIRANLNAATFLVGEEVDRQLAGLAEAVSVKTGEPLATRVNMWAQRVGHLELIDSIASTTQTTLPATATVLCDSLVLQIPDNRQVHQVTLSARYLHQWTTELVDFFFRHLSATDYVVEVTDIATEQILIRRGPDAAEAAPWEVHFLMLGLNIKQSLMTDDNEDRVLGCWQIQARHRDGSVETAVRSAQRWQLWVVIGTLALLFAAAAAVLLAGRRNTLLAQRQIDFVASVSHELRTPLASIAALGQNIADGVVTEPQQLSHYGELLTEHAGRLSALTETTLRLLSMQSQRAKWRHVEVRPLINEAVTRVNRTVHVESTADRAHMDPELVQLALKNLIDNAVKYSPVDSNIHVLFEQENRQNVLRVRSEGPPISAREGAKLFEPFIRGGAPDRDAIPGIGLGLHLVKQVAAAHGGKASWQPLDNGNEIQLRWPNNG